MPTYEYHCEHCEQTFDVFQSFQDNALTGCPTCGNPVRKVYGNVGVVFKGSGFYKNDSRPKEASKSSAENGASTTGSGDSGSTATATKAPPSDGGSKSDSASKGSGAGDGASSTSAPKTPV